MTAIAFSENSYALDHSISLQPLAVGDAEILSDAFAAMPPWLTLGFTAAGLQAFMTRVSPQQVRFAIRRDDTLAGFVCVDKDWLCGPYLRSIGIVPAHQGRGIGSEVVTWFIDQARLAKSRNAWICVSQFNSGAQRLYVAHGFSAAVEFSDLISTGHSEILMRKELFRTSNG